MAGMPKKTLITLFVFLVLGVVIWGAGKLASPQSVALPQAITSEVVCPVAGCTQPDGACHAAAAAPEPDGSFSMVCPKITSCSDTNCHAWDRLTTRYNKPIDASLNLWILTPVLLSVALVLVVLRTDKARKGTEGHKG
jgi:hypothetical protein